jgi:hypothetical protein
MVCSSYRKERVFGTTQDTANKLRKASQYQHKPVGYPQLNVSILASNQFKDSPPTPFILPRLNRFTIH